MKTEIIAAIIGSGALSALVSQVLKWLDKRQERQSGVAEGVRLILKDRLRFLCLHYITQGWIYEDELEDIIAMHACYHDKLRGNGYLDELMAKVRRLPVRGIGM